jgi:site-specific recombinase XerD
MKIPDFLGPLKEEMTHFVKLKQLSGSDYASQAKLLLYFDRHLASRQPNDKILTLETFQSYFDTITHLAKRTFSDYYSALKQFCTWLNQREPNSYILPKCPYVDRSYSKAPYIFSPNEIKLILKNSLTFKRKEEYIPGLYQTLFSLLYSTGIRIGEALALNYGDLREKDMLIHVRKGKFNKERYLILSNSASNQLNEYIGHYKLKVTLKEESPLFVNTYQNRMRRTNVYIAFLKILNKSGIKKDENGPKIYSFSPHLRNSPSLAMV